MSTARGARRRVVIGSDEVAGGWTEILVSRACAQSRLPSEVHGGAEVSVAQRRYRLSAASAVGGVIACRNGRLGATASAEHTVGRIFAGSVRRSGKGAGVPVSLHASYGDRKRTSAVAA